MVKRWRQWMAGTWRKLMQRWRYESCISGTERHKERLLCVAAAGTAALCAEMLKLSVFPPRKKNKCHFRWYWEREPEEGFPQRVIWPHHWHRKGEPFDRSLSSSAQPARAPRFLVLLFCLSLLRSSPSDLSGDPRPCVTWSHVFISVPLTAGRHGRLCFRLWLYYSLGLSFALLDDNTNNHTF